MEPLPIPRLLHFKKGSSPKGHRLTFHSHPFWQMEIDLSSSIEAEFHKSRLMVRPGEMLFIPPHVSHRFYYPEQTNYVTIKFECATSEKPDIRHFFVSPFHTALQSALSALFPADSLAKPPLDMIEPLLGVFVHLYRSQPAEAETIAELTLVEKIERIIENRSGRGLTIKQLAHQFGYSPNFISSEFQKTANETLKTYIDRRRKEQAEHLIAYSDMNISQIADELAFPDVFSFSRFFKRHTGISPIAYRQRASK